MVRYFQYLAAFLLIVGLSACGGGDNKASSAAADRSVEGRAVKGVLQGALVSAYAFDQEHQPTRFLASTLTNDEGYFSFPELPDELIRLVIEANPNGTSTMLCDASDGCGEGISFAQAMPLAEDFLLISLLPAGRPVGTVAVTPLTHIAAMWAEQFPLGVTDQAARLALSQVATVFGLEDDFAWHAPVDVTDTAELSAASPADQAHALLAAGFAQVDGGTNAHAAINRYVQAFIDQGGQLPATEGDGNLQELAEAASVVAQRFADSEINLTMLLGDLQSVYNRWAGPITQVSSATDYDEAAMARAMAPLDDLDGYLRTAGIDESGTFLANQKHQLDWLYGQHTIDLAEVSLGSALTVVEAALITDLMLAQIPPQHMPAEIPLNVNGMPELSAIITVATRQLVISGTQNGQDVNVTVALAPLLENLTSGGKLSYAATASVVNADITGELQGTLEIDLYETDFEPLLSVLSAAMSGSGQSSDALVEAMVDMLANLHARAHIIGDAAIYPNDDPDFSIRGELDAWGEVNVPVLTADAAGPVLSLRINSGELVSPEGDRLFSLGGDTPALHIDIRESATLQAAFGFEAFGLPIFAVEADGEMTGLGELYNQFIAQISNQSLSLDSLIAIVAGMNFSVLDVYGTASIEGDGKRWNFTLDGLRLDATAANDTDVALSFYIKNLSGGYIYSGTELVATVAFDWQNLGATIHFLNGESRSYFAGPLTDILPQELIDLLAGLLGQID